MTETFKNLKRAIAAAQAVTESSGTPHVVYQRRRAGYEACFLYKVAPQGQKPAGYSW